MPSKRLKPMPKKYPDTWSLQLKLEQNPWRKKSTGKRRLMNTRKCLWEANKLLKRGPASTVTSSSPFISSKRSRVDQRAERKDWSTGTRAKRDCDPEQARSRRREGALDYCINCSRTQTSKSYPWASELQTKILRQKADRITVILRIYVHHRFLFITLLISFFSRNWRNG